MGELKLRRKLSSHVNSSPNSNGGNSSTSRLSPISWFSKFMQMGGIHSSPKPTTVEKKKKQKNSVPWPVPDSWDRGRFYCGENDPYFRLSFGGGKSGGGGGLKSVWYDPNERGKFNDMVSDVRRKRMSSSQNSKKIPSENVLFSEQRAKGRTNRRYFELNGEEVEEEEMDPKRGSRNIEEDCRNLTAFEGQTRRKPKQVGGKVRVYSPRTSMSRTECKIKPLEDLKKKKKKRARTKKKKKRKDTKERRAFNRFAVVKTSYNPHGDFRDSMMEMIEEQGIGKPEELEELLACYLTLNSYDYHDLIIKVFRQVWFELNLGSLAPPPYCC